MATAEINRTNSKTAFQQAAKLHEEKKYAEAEALLKTAIADDPGNTDLKNARGVMFAAMGRHQDAIWCYRDALTINPNAPGVWTNLGNALTQLRFLTSAIACHQRALAQSKPDPLLYHNLGTSYAEAGQHGEAVSAFTRSLQAKSDYHTAKWDRARSYLYLGNYQEAWPDYEIRLITGQLPKRDLPGEKWDGAPYGKKRLVLVAEQGFGDTLWVARYLPRVKALGGELIIECRPELIPLMERMRIADQVIPAHSMLPEANYWCYHCSLPGLFTKDFASIPPPPYLPVPHERLGKFREAMAKAKGQLKVGIVWSGSVTFKRNHERAQPLLRFLQAFLVPGVQLYSLQKGPRRKELTELPRGAPMIDLDPLIENFADTAAAIAQLDLVIMTDSAVAHLAGALGRPVWVLLGDVAHWLWLQNRNDNPWYPSMRLFRPRAERDWNYVFDSASAELMKLTGRL